MTDRPWWPLPWPNLAPNSLDQPIFSGWSFGNVQVNYAGSLPIEKTVVTDVASYGKQLGILSEAVLALAGDAPAERAKRLDRLRDIVAAIEAVKDKHAQDLIDSARDAMASLAKTDPAAATRVAAAYGQRPARKT